MIPVEQALENVFSHCATLPSETVALRHAAGRVLAKDAVACRDQPPFSASAMDGYAVTQFDVALGATFNVIGEAAAGHGFDGAMTAHQAVRIFTGAPLPKGTKRVIIQEDIDRTDDVITVTDPQKSSTHIRPAGGDFKIGDRLQSPRLLSAADVALLAAMNIPDVTVTRKPIVALIATGDELVMPGESPNPSQIIASNSFGLAAMVEAAGGIARMLPIAPDREDALRHTFDMAAGADIIVTIGGASVGDYDIVGKVATDMGLDRSFYKIAMRPGKPLMAGKLGGALMLGLPGNPVSSMVTGQLFLVPALHAMLGLPAIAASRSNATLAHDLPANGSREHYMRADVNGSKITVCNNQDSSLMSVLTTANALLVRPVDSPALSAGDLVEFISL